MPKKKIKAPTIAKSLRVSIGKYKEKNPDITLAAIAEYFNVSYHQARSAWLDFRSGKLTQRKPSVNNRKALRIVKEKTIDKIFDEQLHFALAQVEQDTSMNVMDRVVLLDKLSGASKTVRAMKLEAKIKKTDAEIIAAIIRRYEPDASDERVIIIYMEEVEKWKISQS